MHPPAYLWYHIHGVPLVQRLQALHSLRAELQAQEVAAPLQYLHVQPAVAAWAGDLTTGAGPDDHQLHAHSGPRTL